MPEQQGPKQWHECDIQSYRSIAAASFEGDGGFSEAVSAHCRQPHDSVLHGTALAQTHSAGHPKRGSHRVRSAPSSRHLPESSAARRRLVRQSDTNRRVQALAHTFNEHEALLLGSISRRMDHTGRINRHTCGHNGHETINAQQMHAGEEAT